jgi:hypothetical protein
MHNKNLVELNNKGTLFEKRKIPLQDGRDNSNADDKQQ